VSCCLHLYSVTFVPYISKWCHNQEHHDTNQHRRENLKSRIINNHADNFLLNSCLSFPLPHQASYVYQRQFYIGIHYINSVLEKFSDIG
jgi:hypothetical protein